MTNKKTRKKTTKRKGKLPRRRKAKRGRPSKYKPEFVEQARKLGAFGATDVEVADFFGVTESTVYLWKLEHPEFSEALRLGKEGPDDRVEASMFHSAVGYSHPAVKILVVEGKIKKVPYVEHYPPNPLAQQNWLRARRAHLWRETVRAELANADGVPLKQETTYVAGSPELLQDYYRRMEKAAQAAPTDTGTPEDLGRGGPAGEEPEGDPELSPR